MSGPLLALHDAEYTYERSGFTLSCGDLACHAGAGYLISGPNGSGKTTLTKLMCGLLKPDRGHLLIDGEPAEKMPLGRIGQTVGYLFQEPSRQLFAATVWEEMVFINELLGREAEAAEPQAEELLRGLGLWELRQRSVFHLSRGEKQRLALAALLMTGSRFLILDEPTSGLDRDNRAILYRIAQGLLDSGRGLAIVSHDAELQRRFAGFQQLRLLEGQVLA